MKLLGILLVGLATIAYFMEDRREQKRRRYSTPYNQVMYPTSVRIKAAAAAYFIVFLMGMILVTMR